jgi:hypothetical protein
MKKAFLLVFIAVLANNLFAAHPIEEVLPVRHDEIGEQLEDPFMHDEIVEEQEEFQKALIEEQKQERLRQEQLERVGLLDSEINLGLDESADSRDVAIATEDKALSSDVAPQGVDIDSNQDLLVEDQRRFDAPALENSQTKVKFDRVAPLTPEQKIIVEKVLAQPLPDIQVIEAQEASADVAAIRRAFDEEVPNTYLLFSDTYVDQAVGQLVGIFDTMLLNGIDLDAVKFFALIHDVPDIIFELSRLPDAKALLKEQFELSSDIDQKLEIIQKEIGKKGAEFLSMVEQMHQRYGKFLKKERQGGWKIQVLKSDVVFDQEQIEQLRGDIKEVSLRIKALYEHRKKLLDIIKNSTVDEQKWLAGNYTSEGSLNAWRKAYVYKGKKLLEPASVMPEYQKIFKDIASKNNRALRSYVQNLLNNNPGTESLNSFASQLDQVINIFEVKNSNESFLGKKFSRSDFYLKQALRLKKVFEAAYPNVSFASDHASVEYGSLKSLQEIVPEFVTYEDRLKDGSLSIEDFIINVGIDDTLPSKLLEAEVQKLKDGVERGVYISNAANKKDNAVILSKILEKLNEQYPDIISIRDRALVNNAKFPFKILFASESGLGAVMKKLENELVALEQKVFDDKPLASEPEKSRSAQELFAAVNDIEFPPLLEINDDSVPSDDLYKQAVNVMKTITERQQSGLIITANRISSEEILNFEKQILASNKLSGKAKEDKLKEVMAALEKIDRAQVEEQQKQVKTLENKASEISQAVADEVRTIMDLQQDIWNTMIVHSYGKEINLEPFLNYQKRISQILSSKDSKVKVLALLRSIKDQLKNFKDALLEAVGFEDNTPVISKELEQDLQNKFGIDLAQKALELNDLFVDNGMTLFTSNYMHLYISKELKALLSYEDFKPSDALQFVQELKKEVQAETIAEAAQLYAVRVAAMDFSVRMNYVRTMDEALEYARYHRFTAGQKKLLETIKKDILAANAEKLNVDLLALHKDLEINPQKFIVHGTLEQQEALQSILNFMETAFYFDTEKKQEYLTFLFKELFQQLKTLGASGDPIFMALLRTPNGFGGIIESRVVDKLRLILEYYETEVKKGHILDTKLEFLRETLSKLENLLDPYVKKLELTLQTQGLQERPLALRSEVKNLERSLGITSIVEKAYQERKEIEVYIAKQDMFIASVVELRSVIAGLLKEITVSSAQLEPVKKAIEELTAKAQDLSENHTRILERIAQLKKLNNEIIIALNNHILSEKEVYESPTVLVERKVIIDQLHSLTEEQKLLITYEHNLFHMSFANEQTVEFYGQLLRGLKGESFDLLYGVTRPSLSNKGLDQNGTEIRALELAAISTGRDDSDADDVVECTKKLKEVYAINIQLNQLMSGLLQFKVELFDFIEKNINVNTSEDIVSVIPRQKQTPELYVPKIVDTPTLVDSKSYVTSTKDLFDDDLIYSDKDSPSLDIKKTIDNSSFENSTSLLENSLLSENRGNTTVSNALEKKNSEDLLDDFEEKLNQFIAQSKKVKQRIEDLDKPNLGKVAACAIVRTMIESLEKDLEKTNGLLSELSKEISGYSSQHVNS